MIDVSIIVPVYNVEKYLDMCISSLVGQTHRNIEILLINDGSKDSSLSICKKWESIDSRIRVYDKHNEGLGLTRNFGIARAQGKYMQFVDSDDWLRSDAVELLFTKAEEETLDAVYFDFVVYDDNTDQYSVSEENKQYKDDPDFIEKKLKNTILPSSCSIFYNRNKWLSMDIEFPGCNFEDNSVYPFILLNFKRYGILGKGLYYYRFHSGETLSKNRNNFLTRTSSTEALLKKMAEKNYPDRVQNLIKTFAQHQLKAGLDVLLCDKFFVLYNQCVRNYNDFAIKNFGENIFNEIFVPDVFEKLKGYSKIYLYGAGQIAEYTLKRLIAYKILPAGIVVSDTSINPECFCGLGVISINFFKENLTDSNTCVIVSVSKRNQPGVIKILNKYNITDYILYSDLF